MHRILVHKGNTYKTRSNARVRVSTPSGKWINRKVGKKAKIHRCQSCSAKLTSIAALRPAAFARQRLSSRRVARPYGFTHCTNCVADKIVTAFLTEEEKLLKKSE